MLIDTYRISAGGGIASLTRKSEPAPELRAGQIRIAVRAVTLNARDLLIAGGGYPTSHDGPVVPCSDGAGEVIEVAQDVTDWKCGDRVVGGFFKDWFSGPPDADSTATTFGCDLDGWMRSELVMDASSVVRVPAGISYLEAAAAPCAGVTAWTSMFDYARLGEGDSMLVQGTGGVAVWGAQLAKAAGIRCVATSRNPTKLRSLEKLAGVHGVISTPGASWVDDVRSACGGSGANLVLELLGQESIQDSIRAAAFNGRIAVIGGHTGWEYPRLSIPELLVRRISLTGIYVGSNQMLSQLLEFCATNKVHPHIDSVYSFSDAPKAFEQLAEKTHLGKIAISLD